MNNTWQLYLLYLVIVLLLPATDTYFLKKNRKSVQHRQMVEKRSLKLLWICLVVGLIIGVMGKYFEMGQMEARRPIIAIISISLMLGGILFRCWAIGTLGRSFTANIEVSKGQELTTKGPYKYIRHPAYTGLGLFLLGWGLTFESWMGVFGVFGLPLSVILYRIKIEEAALKSFFGKSYSDYMKETKLLVPFVF